MALNAFQEAQDLFKRVYRSNIAPAGQRAQAFVGNVAEKVSKNPVVSQAIQRANAPITAYTGNIKITPQQAKSNLQKNVQTLRQQPSNFLQGNYPVAYKAAEGFGEGLSFNLVDIPAARSTSNKERAAYVVGQAGGIYANPLSRTLNPFAAADRVGKSVVSKFAPQLTGLSSRIAAGVVGEGIQTAGYLGAGEVARRSGLNKFEPLNKETILPQAGRALLFGLLTRGAFAPFSNNKTAVKEAGNVLDKGDIAEIENIYDRLGKKWLGKKGIDLAQYTKDSDLVDTILKSKYGATEKELRIPVEDKIQTLYKIALGDKSSYFKRGAQEGMQMGFAGKQQVAKSALDQAHEDFINFTGTTPGQKERSFINTVRNSANTNPDVAQRINGFYDPITNQETLAKVQKNILEKGVDTARRDLFDRIEIGGASAEDTTSALELMRRYQNEGNFEAAAEVVEKVSKSLTSSGQAIQAASLWSRLTPEGMVLYAQREVQRAAEKQGLVDKSIRELAGKEFTGKLSQEAQERIYTLMKQAETLPAGAEKDALVRQALTQISKEIPLGANEVIDAFRYTNMLSNPITHLRNIYGNMVQTFVTRPATIATDGAIDFVKYALQGKPSTEPLTRVGKYYAGTLNAHSTAVEAFKGVLNGESPIEQLDVRAVRNEKLPAALRAVPSFMEGMDRYFQTMVASGEYQRQLSKGATPEAARRAADEVAKYTLFRGPGEKDALVLKQLDQVTDWILKGRKSVPGLSWFVPFVQTPMNFAKQWVEYSPLGAVTAIGAKNKQEQIAKAMIGSVALGIGANFALTNNATWAAPTDPKEKEAFYASGRKPFSVRVGDTWVPAIYFGPMAWAMMLPAATQYYHEKTRTAGTDSEIQKLINTISSSVEFFSQQTFAQGLGNWTRLLQGDIDYNVASNLAFTAEQLLPFRGMLSYIARAIDPTYRKVPSGTFEQKFIDTIKKDIPYVSKGLPAITNPNGEESRRSPFAPFIPFDVGTSDRQYDTQINDIQQLNQLKAAYTVKQNEEKAQLDTLESDLAKLSPEQKKEYLLAGIKNGTVTKDTLSELAARMGAKAKNLNVADQKLLAQPIAIRAQFIKQQIKGKSPDEIRKILLDYNEKGILTKATLRALAGQE